MLDPSLTIGPFTVRTFTLLLALALLGAAALVLRRAPAPRRAAAADALLAGLILAVIGARVVHVALNWDYFGDNSGEILTLAAGGLDWHGAILGALAGIGLAGRWRRLSLRPLLDTLAICLPLIALMTWWGCWSAGCGAGAEVPTLADYPPVAVWEGPDVFGIYAPRFNTALLGMIGSVVILGLLLAIAWRGWLAGRRLWLALALLGAAMFGLGFLRGDHALYAAGLRLDQWLDALTAALALAVLVLESRRQNQQERVSPTRPDSQL